LFRVVFFLSFLLSFVCFICFQKTRKKKKEKCDETFFKETTREKERENNLTKKTKENESIQKPVQDLLKVRRRRRRRRRRMKCFGYIVSSFVNRGQESGDWE